MTLVAIAASLIVSVAGMAGMAYYSDTDNKAADRLKRLNYVTFVTYVFGLAPLFYFLYTDFGTTATFQKTVPDIVKQNPATIFLILASMFTWIMSAVTLSDVNKDDSKHKMTKYIETFTLLAGFIVFMGFSLSLYSPSKVPAFKMPSVPSFRSAPAAAAFGKRY